MLKDEGNGKIYLNFEMRNLVDFAEFWTNSVAGSLETDRYLTFITYEGTRANI